MQTLTALSNISTSELWERRSELWRIRTDRSVPQHVREGADALLSFYGAEIDARMMRGEASK